MIWLIGIGGSLGAAARYFMSLVITKKGKNPFPLATWLVNIMGSFLLGILVSLHLSNQIQDWQWFLLGIGFCGAFTTFSTFGTETVNLIQAKQFKKALIYVLSTILIGGIAAAIGYTI